MNQRFVGCVRTQSGSLYIVEYRNAGEYHVIRVDYKKPQAGAMYAPPTVGRPMRVWLKEGNRFIDTSPVVEKEAIAI